VITLGLCSVNEYLSLALATPDGCLAEYTIKRAKIDDLLCILEMLLQETGLKTENIEKYVVVNGPGSYAGIRIGLSLIKTLALVNNRPVVTVNLLELMAYEHKLYPGLIVVAVDSRKDEVNFGMYGGHPFNTLIDYSTINKELLFSKLSKIEGDYILLGNLKEIPKALEEKFYYSLPSAYKAILLAKTKTPEELVDILPIYSYPVNISGKAEKHQPKTKNKC